ncbi:MAG: glycoside hydrolase family 28 protein [Lachnospiraceae bacterium]|nr:glycoside hydrolase family 28 protein [Lachnospiraceae bacterium]
MSDFSVLLPSFPEQSFNILDFGAVAGGIVSNTAAINQAVTACHTAGGGKVIIPAGIYLTGPITLLSNVNFHVERGALLMFDKNEKEYPVIRTDYEGQPRLRALSPIHAFDAENIAITGEGTIDGNGHLWRIVKHFKVSEKKWDALLKESNHVIPTNEGGIWFPTKSAYEGCLAGEPDVNDPDAIKKAAPYYDYYRPVMVNLVRCDKVLIEGVTLQNSPAWNVHPLLCTNLTIRNASIRNDWAAQNGDGLDLESCQFVEIDNVKFDVGDDAICMKSGKNAVARVIPVPTKHVRIHDCVVYHGHGGFVVGSEMSRGVCDVTISDCTFIGTDVGIRFKSAIGRGGVVEDITMRDINMVNIAEDAIIFTMGYTLYHMDHQASDEPDQINADDIPEFKNITIQNVTCTRAGRALKVEGLEVLPIHDITLENVSILAQKGYTINNAENIRMKNVSITNELNPSETILFEDTILKSGDNSAF